MKINNTGHSLA